MQRPLEKPNGTPVEELDTPALILDLATLDATASRFADLEQPARAEVWVHKTPAIARIQVAIPGISGIAVRSVAEAEVFAAAGFDDIRILRPLATPASQRRVEAIANSATLAFKADRPLAGADWFEGAVTVSARVVSVPEPGRAILDAGQKAVGRDFGDPRLLGRPRCAASAGSAEHGVVSFPADDPFSIGDWLELVPADVATTFALHDFVYATRNGVLEAVWPISARGAF
ncbi:MAG: hypothetical protein OXI79_19175 [Gammaproteobacteria bacterium]|nr:hypothetical protein [Gammaproteobacteria bacterium]